ncbi:hypothetical protein VTG60DRAFT_7273 [Thermothelomyces hinnuleus]
MPTGRKRSSQELSTDDAQDPAQPSMLHRLRNMWQFANLYQFIVLFGQALKLDDNLDIEDLEAECLKPGSMALQDIGLGLLKFLSSHRGLTHELFDEYTRRQFLSKAPEKNPFGTAEEPAKFAQFDVFTKIRVLQQMTQLIMMNPERLRERTEEQKDTEQTSWRIEPYGWDRHDRTYFVLDDNRLYRLTDAPPPPPKPKKNTKKSRAAQRSSKRRRVATGAASDADAHDDASESKDAAEPEDDGLGGMKWECIAVTLDEVREFLSTIQKSKDANEKTLYNQIQNHLVPILEKQEESRKRKQLQREKELLNLQKLAFAKRSSRIASRMEQQRMEERAREEERKRLEEEAARRKQEEKRLKMERERERRLMSRERRLREREARRRLYEEELAQLSEGSRGASNASARMSERRRLAEIERNKKALQELDEEEEDWIFDCVCGVYGKVDDGTHSVACEKCNIWQHSKCLGISEEEADKEDFHFICSSCRRRQEAADDSRPRVIKIKVSNHHQASNTLTSQQQVAESTASPQEQPQGQSVAELGARPSPNAADSSEPLPTNQGRSVQETPAVQPAQSSASNPQQQETSGDATNNCVPERETIQGPPASQGNSPFPSPHPSLLPSGGQSTQRSLDESTRGTLTPLPSGDDGKAGLVAKSAELTAPPSTLPGSGSGASPSKRQDSPPCPPTKTSSTVSAAPSGLAPPLSAENIGSVVSSSSMSLPPHLSPAPSHDVRSDHAASSSSPLPPSSGGLSPTKHSPPAPRRPQQHVNGGASSAASPMVGGSHPPSTVFPPVASLSPSPRQQILTPPVKPAEPVRVPPPQVSKGVQPPKLTPASSPQSDAQSS